MTSLAEYNNNPGNIRPAKGVKYEGMIGVDDKGFAVFATPKDGQKALVEDLTHKIEKRGIKTPSEFVDIYSPAGEENSEDSRDNYKIYIAQQLGLKSTSDPFPENAVSKLAQAVSAFEGGTWQDAKKEEAAPEPTRAEPDPADQYSGNKVSSAAAADQKTTGSTPKETGAMGAAIGAGAGSLYTAHAPALRLAQRIGLLSSGKTITPTEAAALVEKIMATGQPTDLADMSVPQATAQGTAAAPAKKPSGGENWQKSLTGISTPGAQMDKSSLDLAKRMQGTVGIGGAPGFVGGTITEGGIILNPQDASAMQARQQAAAAQAARNEMLQQVASAREAGINERLQQVMGRKAAEGDARLRQTLQQSFGPDVVQRGVRNVWESGPVRGALTGLGIGYNAQDAYNQFQQGNVLGGTLATGAAGASGLSLVPKLAPVMGPAAVGLTTAAQIAGDLGRGDRQAAAESGLTGLTALAPGLFGPAAAALYSRGLNEGEEEELKRRRKMAATVTP